jgi:hypothetical protein
MVLPAFSDWGSTIQAASFAGSFATVPAASSERLATCVRSGPSVPMASVPRTVWHCAQLDERNNCRPRIASSSRRLGRRQLLPRAPLGIGLGRVGTDAESHQRMLQSAELRALAAVGAGLVGPQQQLRAAPGQHVLLAVQARHPEGVDHVGALERHDHRLGRPARAVRWTRRTRACPARRGSAPPTTIAGRSSRCAARPPRAGARARGRSTCPRRAAPRAGPPSRRWPR